MSEDYVTGAALWSSFRGRRSTLGHVSPEALICAADAAFWRVTAFSWQPRHFGSHRCFSWKEQDFEVGLNISWQAQHSGARFIGA